MRFDSNSREGGRVIDLDPVDESNERAVERLQGREASREQTRRLVEFLSLINNRNGRAVDLSKDPETSHHGAPFMEKSWVWSKTNPLGYDLASDNMSPGAMRLHVEPVLDDQHLQEIMNSARAEAISSGKSLHVDLNSPGLKDRNMDFVYVTGAVNQGISLPVTENEFRALSEQREVTLADNNYGTVIRNGKGYAQNPVSLFCVPNGDAVDMPIRTTDTPNNSINFLVGDSAGNLGNIFYATNGDPSPENFSVSIVGRPEDVRKIRTVPIYDRQRNSGFMPTETFLNINTVPSMITPSDMAEMIDDMPGEKRHLHLVLDDRSADYDNDRRYIMNVYDELMRLNPDQLTLSVDIRKQDGQGRVEHYDINSGPGAAFNPDITPRREQSRGVEKGSPEMSL